MYALSLLVETISYLIIQSIAHINEYCFSNKIPCIDRFPTHNYVKQIEFKKDLNMKCVVQTGITKPHSLPVTPY